MLKNIDIKLCIAAWLLAIVSYLALLPPFHKGEWAYQLKYFQVPWLLCVIGLIIFRKRPWRKLWSVWLSLLILYHDYAALLFVVIVFTSLTWILLKSPASEVFQWTNLDFVFGLMAWACAPEIMYSGCFVLPFDQVEYLTTYGPLAWIACIIGMLLVSKRPWWRLWWAAPSGLLVFAFWEMVIMVGIALSHPH